MNSDSTHTERRLNTRSKIYKALYHSDKPMSKLEIAELLSISMPTLYQNIGELMDMGLIKYSGLRPSSGGRPAMNLEVVADARYAIGVSIQTGRINFAAINLKCRELAYKTVYPLSSIFSREYIDFFAGELEKFIDESGIEREKLLGVGICIPGTFLSDGFTVNYAPALGIKSVSMKPLADAVPYPVHLDNDANSAGFAVELQNGSSGGLAYLSLADGVGGTLFLNGVQHRGSNSLGGEFGHMTVEYNGRRCACGKKGCLEAYCSEYRILTDSGVTLEKFFSNLADGDEKTGAIWENYLEHLATAIHNIRMAFDSKIVMGGIMAYYLQPYLGRLKEYVYGADPFTPDQDYLSISGNPLHVTVLGAAMYFVKGFLDEN